MERKVLRQKAENVKEIRTVIQKYQSIGIANLQKVRSTQLQELRKKLRGTAQIRVIKNSLIERAISEQQVPNTEKLKEYVKGSNVYIFTDLNPFKLARLIEKSKVRAIAKVGDVAFEDVLVPAGNTGLPPGPVISQLGSVGLQTRIESGSVWVNRDTVVAKKGDVINESLAPILSKLGIKAVEAGIALKMVYDGGTIIPWEQLKLDIDGFKQSLSEAYAEAFKLSLSAAVPLPENIAALVQAAALEARNLAVGAGVVSKETIGDLVRKAHSEATALSTKVAG